MYESFFGLQKRPFSLTADSAFLFLTQQHREALAGLSYAILSRKGLVVLTGEAGTGKTTLLVKTLKHLPAAQLLSSVILNPTLKPSEFLELVLLDFGIAEVPTSKAQRIWILQELLMKSRREKKTVALIVDEAHKLSPQVLEEIRLLGNFEASGEKLLQIVLIGQPELATVLNQHDLRQFKQRIAVRLSIQPLSPHDLLDYIRFRWTTAGGGTTVPFDGGALSTIAQASRGIPRLVNSICDNALLTVFAEGRSRVEAADVNSALSDLDLLVSGGLAVGARNAPVQAQPVVIKANQTAVKAEIAHQSVLDRWAGRFGFVPSNGKR